MDNCKMGRKYSALMSLVFVVVMLFEIKGARGGGINPSNTTKTSSYTRPRKASGNLIRSNNETVFGAQTQHIPSPPSGVVEPVVEESRTAEVKGDSLPNSESQTHAAGLLRSAVKKEKSENGRGGVEGKLILLSTHSNVRERESTGGNAQVKAPPWGKAPDWWDAPDDEKDMGILQPWPEPGNDDFHQRRNNGKDAKWPVISVAAKLGTTLATPTSYVKQK